MVSQISTLQREARSKMDAQQWAGASALWAEIRARHPDGLLAYTSGVDALIRCYRFDEAFALADEIHERFGSRTNAALFLASLARRRGRWADAEARFVRAFEAAPDAVGPLDRLADYRQAVLNVYGIFEGNRRLAPIPHDEVIGGSCAIAAGWPGRFIFVSGMPRAGTTALGHLLNIRTDVALLTEMHNPYFPYAPACFAPDVIANQRKRQPRTVPDHIFARTAEAVAIGDKRPQFHYSLPQTLEIMAGAPVVVFHILRDPVHVAASYAARARDPADQWDPLRDLDQCIHELNVMHRFLIDWHRAGRMEEGHRLIFVDYARLFADPDYAIDLIEQAGLVDSASIAPAVRRFVEKSTSIASRSRKVDPDIRAAVVAGLDLDAARGVAALTGIEMFKILETG